MLHEPENASNDLKTHHPRYFCIVLIKLSIIGGSNENFSRRIEASIR